MCGIAAIFGAEFDRAQLSAIVAHQHHRGPDDSGVYHDPRGLGGLGHNRLSILDLSSAGRQPMASSDGRYWISFNGEIYNYRELRQSLPYSYRSQTDTEVILAAYERWGRACLDRFLGMFALLIWDEHTQTLFGARDRFGVKPLYYSRSENGTLVVASEIGALRTARQLHEPDAATWATYLAQGIYDHDRRTFWKGVYSLPAGHFFTWRDARLEIHRWYDLSDQIADEPDPRSEQAVCAEYRQLLEESVRLRFRSDVPVGINLSGGVDSSLLLSLVDGIASDVKTFTFVTGDARYDESPWVQQMLARTGHQFAECLLSPELVPDLAESVQCHQDEPFGGLPTLAYARLFEQARSEGIIVLLDGQGLDEQWAGYDYYATALNDHPDQNAAAGTIQGTRQATTRPDCLTADFRGLAEPFNAPRPFSDPLRNLQYRDTYYTKLPRALRFNDRVSMRASTELREPFLDHRLFELALSQPTERKISGGTHKRLLREMTASLLPAGVVTAPKRPLQTPQREWLRGPLRDWANDCIQTALTQVGDSWLDPASVRRHWQEYQLGIGDNSFFIWQWINLGLSQRVLRPPLTEQSASTEPCLTK